MIVKFREISKNNLKVDHSYQRPLVHSEYRQRMKRSWSWALFGTLLVGERSDRTMWVVDGQQRHSVALELDHISKLPCMVFESRGPSHEAEIFKDRGSVRTALTPHTMFNARVIANDPLANTINDVVRAQGYHIGASETLDTIDCIGTIFQSYVGRSFTPHENALVALGWCMDAANHKFQIKRDLFTGFDYLARRDHNYLTLDHIQRLYKYSGEEIYTKIRAQKLIDGADGGRSAAIALIKLINHNRPIRNRLPYPGQGGPE